MRNVAAVYAPRLQGRLWASANNLKFQAERDAFLRERFAAWLWTAGRFLPVEGIVVVAHAALSVHLGFEFVSLPADAVPRGKSASKTPIAVVQRECPVATDR